MSWNHTAGAWDLAQVSGNGEQISFSRQQSMSASAAVMWGAQSHSAPDSDSSWPWKPTTEVSQMSGNGQQHIAINNQQQSTSPGGLTSGNIDPNRASQDFAFGLPSLAFRQRCKKFRQNLGKNPDCLVAQGFRAQYETASRTIEQHRMQALAECDPLAVDAEQSIFAVNGHYMLMHVALMDKTDDKLRTLIPTRSSSSSDHTAPNPTCAWNPMTGVPQVSANELHIPSSEHSLTPRAYAQNTQNYPAPHQMHEQDDEQQCPNDAENQVSADRSGPLTNRGRGVLSRWYENHKKRPYPDKRQIQQLAKQCHVTQDKVTNWFRNERQRSGYLKANPHVRVRGKKRGRSEEDVDVEGQSAKKLQLSPDQRSD